MAEAVLSAQWDQTSVLWATIANANRDPEKQRQPFTPQDIHPFVKAKFTTRKDRGVIIDEIRRKQQLRKQYGQRQPDSSGRSLPGNEGG